MNFLVYAIHTVPDTETGAIKYDLGDLDEKSAIKAITHLQQQSGKEELPHFMQRIVAISTVFRGEGVNLEINTYGEGKSESEILNLFFKKINHNKIPTFISWDSTGTDMPVLTYRCMKHEVPLPAMTVNPTISLKNELSRYNPLAATQQQDVMDLLQLKATPALSTKKIWKHWRNGEHELISHSCTCRALDSYRIYIRFQYVMGMVTLQHYQHEVSLIERLIAQRMAENFTS